MTGSLRRQHPTSFIGQKSVTTSLGEGLILYLFACASQTWVAGAVILLLPAGLGISFHVPDEKSDSLIPLFSIFYRLSQLKTFVVGRIR